MLLILCQYFPQYRYVLFVPRHSSALFSQHLDLLLDHSDGELAVVYVLAKAQRRHDQQHLVVRVDLVVVAVEHDVPADLNSIVFELVGSFVASEHVFGEVLEHDDYSQGAIRVVVPVIELALREPLEVDSEPDRDLVAVVASPLS